MPDSSLTEDSQNCSQIDIEELRSYKFLLGDFGISMLVAIARGAKNRDTIKMLSGVPSACISGRMPVLLSLKLVENQNSDEFVITSRGTEFLRCINESFH